MGRHKSEADIVTYPLYGKGLAVEEPGMPGRYYSLTKGWWDGSHHEFPPAYMVVDSYDDGSSRSEFVPYQWDDAGSR